MNWMRLLHEGPTAELKFHVPNLLSPHIHHSPLSYSTDLCRHTLHTFTPWSASTLPLCIAARDAEAADISVASSLPKCGSLKLADLLPSWARLTAFAIMHSGIYLKLNA